jgi:MYXO-CTERM domain-containing protein
MSVHGTGRALDVMIPMDDGDADNDLGDPVANFLVQNAEAIGIQYIIWDRWSWRADRDPGSKDREYTGTIPHLDHPHVEMSVEASLHTEMWFSDSVTPPAIEGCDSIPPEGAIVDDESPCFRAFGPAEYWRVEDGVGYDGRLRWTNAFESDEPSNWARWHLSFVSAGNYEVEIFLDPAFAVADGVPYEITAGGESQIIHVDQSAASGWLSLGTFAFDEGGMQQLDVWDAQPEPVPDDQHIAVDAIRLTGEGLPPPDDPGNPLDPSYAGTPDPTDPSTWGITGSNDGCNCRVGPSGHGSDRKAMLGVWVWVLLAWARRRRS